MKKLLLALIIVLLLPIVMAGNTYYLEDLSKYPLQQVTMEEKDRIEFILFDARHTIIINKMIPYRSIDLDIFPYLESVTYATLKKDTYLSLDLNKDYKEDLTMRIGEINNKTVKIIIFKKQVKENQITGEVVAEEPRIDPNKIIGVILIGLIMIVGVVSYLVIRKK
jgi:hypothetical protein